MSVSINKTINQYLPKPKTKIIMVSVEKLKQIRELNLFLKYRVKSKDL